MIKYTKIGRENKQLLEYTVNVKLQGPQLTSGLYPAIQYCDFSVLNLEPSHVLFYPQTISSTSYSLYSQCSGLQNKVFVPLGIRKTFQGVPKDMGSVMAIRFHILNFHIDIPLFIKILLLLSLTSQEKKYFLFTHLVSSKGAQHGSTEQKILNIGVDI